MLSRLLPETQIQDVNYVIASATIEYNIKFILQDNINPLPVGHHMFQAASIKDCILQQVASWARKSKDLNNIEFLPYFNRKPLSIVDGCLLSGERLIAPSIFTNHILKTLHKGHQSHKRMKAIIRGSVYWPNIILLISNTGGQNVKFMQNYQSNHICIYGQILPVLCRQYILI